MEIKMIKKELIGKIIKQVLIYVNQYDEVDAEECYKDEEGSEFWEAIDKILSDAVYTTDETEGKE